jgi:hypothetical protein
VHSELDPLEIISGKHNLDQNFVGRTIKIQEMYNLCKSRFAQLERIEE